MKINALTSSLEKNYVQMNKNVSFGHIYSRALDTLRTNSDGYFKTFEYDAWDDYHDSPDIVEAYRCKRGEDKIVQMSDKEVSILEKLVERASKLKKSIISSHGSFSIAMVVDKDGKRVFENSRNFQYYNPEYNLAQLEILVKEAEEYEKNPEAAEIEPIVAKDKYIKANAYRCEPRYFDMYAKTVCNDGCRER